jgi:putative ABC transport system substrate-binding protein
MQDADAMAVELVRSKVDVIVATPLPAAQAAKRATSTIPIIFAPAGDPVANGLVDSLARPGHNLTGFTTASGDVAGKLLALLREASPHMNRVAVLIDEYGFAQQFLHQVQAGAVKVNVRVTPIIVRERKEFSAAFAAMEKEHIEGLIVLPRYGTKVVADLAAKHGLPSITSGIGGDYADSGGLLYYGVSPAEQSRRIAEYVARVLKGAKPADLPVEQPTTFEFVVNRRTAADLGIAIPQTLMLRADRVIH